MTPHEHKLRAEELLEYECYEQAQVHATLALIGPGDAEARLDQVWLQHLDLNLTYEEFYERVGDILKNP